MKYHITKKRFKFLEDNFFEFSFEGREPDRTIFDGIEKPEELHVIAWFHNWDDGAEVLNWIVNSPVCDSGTAKLIFWRSQPDYYTTFSSEEDAGSNADVYCLLRTIIQNFEDGFYKKHEIAYDPNTDEGAPMDIDYRDPEEKWEIPSWMKVPVQGGDILVS